MSTAQFHLAFGVRDLEEARAFYLETIGCKQGRATANHIDFDLFGHHVVAHLVPAAPRTTPGEFDGHEVPVPHFGVNLERDDWEQLANRLKRSRCQFREYPHTRLVGQVGEHDTLFVHDPSGNSLEFKSFRNPSHVFASDATHDGARVPDREQVLRPRVEAVIHRTHGSVQEPLLVSGFLDSIRAIELVAALQQDLGMALAELQISDLATVTTLVAAIAASERATAGAAPGEHAPAEAR